MARVVTRQRTHQHEGAGLVHGKDLRHVIVDDLGEQLGDSRLGVEQRAAGLEVHIGGHVIFIDHRNAENHGQAPELDHHAGAAAPQATSAQLIIDPSVGRRSPTVGEPYLSPVGNILEPVVIESRKDRRRDVPRLSQFGKVIEWQPGGLRVGPVDDQKMQRCPGCAEEPSRRCRNGG